MNRPHYFQLETHKGLALEYCALPRDAAGVFQALVMLGHRVRMTIIYRGHGHVVLDTI